MISTIGINLGLNHPLWGRAVCDPGTAIMAGSMAATAIGGGIAAEGTIAGGKFAQQAAEYKRSQDIINSSQALAAGQRQMFGQEENARMALSTLRARAAGSGVDLTSPGAVGLASDIAGRGSYNSAMALWQGQNTAASDLTQAAADRASGEAAMTGSEYAAAGTIANAGASMLSTYGTYNYRTGQGANR